MEAIFVRGRRCGIRADSGNSCQDFASWCKTNRSPPLSLELQIRPYIALAAAIWIFGGEKLFHALFAL
jgi:hypothetical protein